MEIRNESNCINKEKELTDKLIFENLQNETARLTKLLEKYNERNENCEVSASQFQNRRIPGNRQIWRIILAGIIMIIVILLSISITFIVQHTFAIDKMDNNVKTIDTEQLQIKQVIEIMNVSLLNEIRHIIIKQIIIKEIIQTINKTLQDEIKRISDKQLDTKQVIEIMNQTLHDKIKRISDKQLDMKQVINSFNKTLLEEIDRILYQLNNTEIKVPNKILPKPPIVHVQKLVEAPGKSGKGIIFNDFILFLCLLFAFVLMI